MPMERWKYPDDWERIAREVKDEAGWRCERCGKQCRRPGEPFDTHRCTLTVSHINHDLRAVVERLGIEWSESELHGLMDALDHRLMPFGMEWLVEAWPRFEDGEPLRFGDIALIDGDVDMVEAVQLWIHGRPVICGDGGSQQLDKGERVKRPAPKDSWERLEEDAKLDACDYFNGVQHHDCSECPTSCLGGCEAQKAADLVRRAKALAGDA